MTYLVSLLQLQPGPTRDPGHQHRRGPPSPHIEPEQSVLSGFQPDLDPAADLRGAQRVQVVA